MIGFPLTVAGVFATITGVSSAFIGELGDSEGAISIGALIPFFMMVLMAKGFIVATPFIVRVFSGNIMMPALSGGLGGSHSFARAAIGNQLAYNRYLVSGASGAEYAALRARQFFWSADVGAVGTARQVGKTVALNSGRLLQYAQIVEGRTKLPFDPQVRRSAASYSGSILIT